MGYWVGQRGCRGLSIGGRDSIYAFEIHVAAGSWEYGDQT